MECLSRSLEREPPGGALDLGVAFSRAQRCLYSENLTQGPDPKSLYAHLVLSFTLAGNPNLALCGPE